MESRWLRNVVVGSLISLNLILKILLEWKNVLIVRCFLRKIKNKKNVSKSLNLAETACQNAVAMALSKIMDTQLLYKVHESKARRRVIFIGFQKEFGS